MSMAPGPAAIRPASIQAAPVGPALSLHQAAETHRRRLCGMLRTFAVAGFQAGQYPRLLGAHWHLLGALAEGALATAAHDWARARPALRTPLIRLGLRWESCRELAAEDLAHLGVDAGPPPIDVTLWRLWHARLLVEDLPTAFIGAAAVQDQLLTGVAADALRDSLAGAKIPPHARRCIDLLATDAGEHLEPLLSALQAADVDEDLERGLWLGAHSAGLMLLRLVRACLDEDDPTREIDSLLDPEILSD